MQMLRIGIIVIIFVSLMLVVVYVFLDPLHESCKAAKHEGQMSYCPRYIDLAFTLTLFCSAIITLFGSLAIDGAKNEDGTFRESRIRLSIAMSVLLIYITVLSMSIFWPEDSYNQEMFGTLTNMLMVVIPFYFGASAAVEWKEKEQA